MKNSKQGFTLIEILVVIAIIGILASVALVGLGPVQKKGRDARRISDLRQIQTALELYFTKNGSYPPSGFSNMEEALTGGSIGIKSIPHDPKAGQDYEYGSTNDNNSPSYTLGAHLEDENNPVLKDSAASADGVSCAPDEPATYCVSL
jgi:prepilin-type N-terminal cleavage/methylation domain-containing protein